MEHSALKELYIDELRDIYHAETQLVKALPKMAKASTSDDLRSGFESHLEQTKGHVQRLEEIFDALDEKPSGKKCAGMQGLVKEGEEIMDEDFEGEVMDAADRKSTRLNSSHMSISYAVFCLKKKKNTNRWSAVKQL